MDSSATVLHRLVWFNDWEGLDAQLAAMAEEDALRKSKQTLQEAETSQTQLAAAHDTSFASNNNASPAMRPIDRKFRGLTPLHLAIQLGHSECINVLLNHEADTLIGTDLGFLPLQEATSIGDRDLMRCVLLKRHEQFRRLVRARQPHIFRVMHEDLFDFYLEMNWDFKSWVPFFSMLCPSDCYRIWKRGTRIRIDTSLLGFEKLRWLRGNASFLFILEKNDTHCLLLDHDRKIYQPLKKLRDYTASEVEEDLNLRLNQEIVCGRVDSQQPIKFSRSRSILGLGDEIVEAVGRGGYDARVYSIENMEWVTRTRKEHLRDRPEGDLSDQTSSWFLGYGGRTAFSALKGQQGAAKTNDAHTRANANVNKHADSAEATASDTDSTSNTSTTATTTIATTTTDSNTATTNSSSGGVKSLYRESVKEIRDALNKVEEEVIQDDLAGITEHLDDFDPNKINALIEDANQLALVHTPSLPPPHSQGPPVPFEKYFALDAQDLSQLPLMHVGRRLAYKEHRKHLSASLWMADDFPLTLQQLLPLIEIMSPSNEHFDKLRQFISLKLPPGFPVQLELPVLLFLSARVTFQYCLPWNRETRKQVPFPAAADPMASSASWFEVPDDYREGIVVKSIFKKCDDSSSSAG